MPRIDDIEIDDHILEKIEIKDGVTFEECQEAVFSIGRRFRVSRARIVRVYDVQMPGVISSFICRSASREIGSS